VIQAATEASLVPIHVDLSRKAEEANDGAEEGADEGGGEG
jgi:hypothetical protein